MSYFDKKEFVNFLKYSKKHPFEALKDLTDIGMFISGNMINKLKFKFLSDKHSARKKWPTWLRSDLFLDNTDSVKELFFPSLTFDHNWDRLTIHARENITLAKNDPEAVFKLARWSTCNYYLDPNQEEAKEVVRLINRWIADPPAFDHPAWETYSAAERIANSIVFLSLDKRRQDWLDREKYATFLSASMKWIVNHLEFYGPLSTNNHFLNDARALIMGGVVSGDKRYINIGLKIVENFGMDLFTENGFLRERSTHYQIVIANWIMDADTLLQTSKLSAGTALPKSWNNLVEKVYEATIYQIKQFGWDTLIGDISPDISPKASAYRFMKLYGNRNHRISFSKPSINDPWFYLSDEKSLIIGSSYNGKVICQYPTHRHNDATGFIWKYNHVPILVDAGRLNYTKDWIAIKQVSFRGHNTLSINEAGAMPESIIINGGYLPARYSNVNISTQSANCFVVIKHNGFSRLMPGIEHTRTISINADGIEVSDELTGTGKIEASLYYHFDHGFELNKSGQIIKAKNPFAEIIFDVEVCNNEHLQTAIDSYELSPEYGTMLLAPEIIVTGELTLPCRISTKFKVYQCVE